LEGKAATAKKKLESRENEKFRRMTKEEKEAMKNEKEVTKNA
jgi:hypothetical protein